MDNTNFCGKTTLQRNFPPINKQKLLFQYLNECKLHSSGWSVKKLEVILDISLSHSLCSFISLKKNNSWLYLWNYWYIQSLAIFLHLPSWFKLPSLSIYYNNLPTGLLSPPPVPPSLAYSQRWEISYKILSQIMSLLG